MALRNQCIDLRLFGPLAVWVILLQYFQPQLQFLRIMARLVFSHPEIVLSLWSGVSLGITDQHLLETLHGLLKAVLIEFNLALAENDLSNEILRRQKPHEAMVFVAIRIQDNDGGGPFNGKSLHQSLVFVEINLKGNEVILYSETDIRIGVSNSCQLLAPNSEVVVEVHQN